MSIEAIAAVSSQIAALAPAAAPVMSLAPPADPSVLASMTDLLATQPGASAGESLFDKLVSSLGEINAGTERSREAATELALGQSDNLHQMLISGERTRLQFELAMSMRNRVLEAYQEIMRMQV